MTTASRGAASRHLEAGLAPDPAGSSDLDDLLNDAALGGVTTLTLVVGDRPNDDGVRSAQRLLSGLPALASVRLATPGRLSTPDRLATSDRLSTSDRTGASALAVILAVCRLAAARGIPASVQFTLDPASDAFDVLAGRPNPLADVVESSRALGREGLTVQWAVPTIPALVYRLDPLFSLAADTGADALLLPPSGQADLDPDARLFLRDFVDYRLLAETRLDDDRSRLYRDLSAWAADPTLDLSPHRRNVTCLGMDRGNRAVTREPRWITELPAPEDAALRAAASGGGLADVAGVLWEGSRGLLQWLLAGLTGRARPAPAKAADHLPTVLLIGAYGGEHIGDAAILGGVLLRLARERGTSRAVLVSQRPAHTRHLIPMLDVPVDVTVDDYGPAALRAHLAEVDAVVFAGGPLIDIPRQLVKHLYAVSLARRLGKPFLAEGIGPGPFVRAPSAWVARRLVNLASRITVRTSTCAGSDIMRGLGPVVGHDPAFDYLETRPAELTRLPEPDAAALDGLLAGTAGRRIVGVNVRPINPVFTTGTSGRDREARTRSVEDRFERNLAAALTRFNEDQGGNVSVVFFPMNAIQFGQSDLHSAYRIARHLPPNVDFRVWQADASLDGVVALLRRLDIAVTMRFHATIFCLSQGCPVIGVDYGVGRDDKVAALLEDFGQADDCCRIDTMTPEWLAGRLAARAADNAA